MPFNIICPFRGRGLKVKCKFSYQRNLKIAFIDWWNVQYKNKVANVLCNIFDNEGFLLIDKIYLDVQNFEISIVK